MRIRERDINYDTGRQVDRLTDRGKCDGEIYTKKRT